MGQTVACPHNSVPGDVRVCLTHLSRDMGGCLADQLQIAQGSVIRKGIGDKRILIQVLRIGEPSR